MSATVVPLEQRFERLRSLTEVSRALTYATSIDEVLDLAVRRAAELVDADRAVLMLTNADGQLVVSAAYGIDEEELAHVPSSLDESVAGKLRDLLGSHSPECFLSVPLVVQGQVTGLLGAVRNEGEVISSDDEWLLSALADQAAVALENARLIEGLAREREERARASEAQGRAQATLGHELRSPLSAILSSADLLLDGFLGELDDRQREAVSRVRMSGDHLAAVIENVLDMAQIHAGEITLRRRDVAASGVVSEAVDLVQHRANQKDQALRVRAEREVVVRADQQRLRQALVNLIGNAIKYTPAGGNIEVLITRTEEEDGRSGCIAVTDDGPGMSPALVERIFQPYERGNARDGSGLGLGLSISRELLRQMDGDIEVRSAPGEGSTFTVFLPVAEGYGAT